MNHFFKIIIEMMEKFDKDTTNGDRQKQRPLIRVENDSDEQIQAKSGCC